MKTYIEFIKENNSNLTIDQISEELEELMELPEFSMHGFRDTCSPKYNTLQFEDKDIPEAVKKLNDRFGEENVRKVITDSLINNRKEYYNPNGFKDLVFHRYNSDYYLGDYDCMEFVAAFSMYNYGFHTSKYGKMSIEQLGGMEEYYEAIRSYGLEELEEYTEGDFFIHKGIIYTDDSLNFLNNIEKRSNGKELKFDTINNNFVYAKVGKENPDKKEVDEFIVECAKNGKDLNFKVLYTYYDLDTKGLDDLIKSAKGMGKFGL